MPNSPPLASSTLQRLKLHPREDQANLAVLARAERLYAETLGEGRRELQAAIVEFRGLLESQDLRAIQSARARFAAWLDARERELGW